MISSPFSSIRMGAKGCSQAPPERWRQAETKGCWRSRRRTSGRGSLYHDPFAVLQVTNNRVLVFPGAAGAATVITLTAPNTTVLEVLALAGGVAARGNASQVKLIRRTATGHQVYRMDLSTAAGLSAASTVVQANDVLYVDPVPDVASEVLRDINPIVSIVSSLSVLWALLTNAL